MNKQATNLLSYDDMTDEVLFAKFQKNGDQKAFNTLLKRYKGPIFSLILKSVRNHAQVEDVFQDVFYKVVERRDQFRTSVSFKAWLYTISRNTCIDRQRKVNRTPAINSIFVDEEKPLEINLDTKELTPHELASGAQIGGLIDSAFKTIPPEQRETFYLKTKGEFTFEEIGELMNCSVNTAKSRMRYALEHLRKIFKKRGYFRS